MASPAPHRLLVPRHTQGDQARDSHITLDLSTVPKQISTSVACVNCRARKIRCDGAKPTCSTCNNRRLTCTYRKPNHGELLKRKHKDLQQASSGLQQVLELLRTAPADTAESILRDLRGKSSVAEILQSIGSSPRAAAAPSLSTYNISSRTSLEHDLTLRFPNAFPTLEPLTVSDMDLKLLQPGYKGTGIVPPLPPTTDPFNASFSASLNGRAAELSADSAYGSSGDSASPADVAHYADSRLEFLDVQLWTNVHISNSFAARAISFYLTNEQPVLGHLPVELFLEDLIHGNERFCSALLVSAVLAWSCATYGQFDPKATHLSELLFEEAKERWEGEEQTGSLSTVSALLFMALTVNSRGLDRQGVAYLIRCAEIGIRLGIFNCPDGSTSFLQEADQSTLEAASFVAWGVFNWLSLDSLFFRRQHLLTGPPSLPIPGDEQGPVLPTYMGSTFTWLCMFWQIIQATFGSGYSIYLEQPLEYAEAAYQKLLAWSSALPKSASRDASSPHHVLIMHIWYHSAIMDLWRPFTDTGRVDKLRTMPVSNNWPIAAYNASATHLKRILYSYRERFETTNLTMLITPGYLSLLNEIFQGTASRDAQFYFIISARGCLAIAPWCTALRGITRAFLSLAWRTGAFQKAGWTGSLIDNIRETTVALVDDQNLSSLYPIDLGLANESGEAGNMETLAKEFQQLAVRREVGAMKRRAESANGPSKPNKVWRGDIRDLDLTLSEAMPEYKEHQ